MIDTGTSEPVSQKPYPIVMKHYQWVKDKIEKPLTAKLIWGSQSSWSAPIIVVPKGDGGKHFVIDYCTLNKVTRQFIWPMPEVEDIFSQINGANILNIGPTSRIEPYSFGWILNPHDCIHLIIWKVYQSTFGLTQVPAYFQELLTGILRFQFHNCLSGWHHHSQQDSRRTPQPPKMSFLNAISSLKKSGT